MRQRRWPRGGGLWLVSVVMLSSSSACARDAYEPPSASQQAGSAVETTTTLEPPTTTTTAPTGITATAHFAVVTEDRYSYKLDYRVVVGEPTTNVADAKPGAVYLKVPISGEVTVTNTTPQRNLPDYNAVVAVTYTAADYAAITGQSADDPMSMAAACRRTDGLCTIARAAGGNYDIAYAGGDYVTPVGAGQQITVPLQPNERVGQVMEDDARATMELIRQRRPPTLAFTLDAGSTVSACSPGIAVFVKEHQSLGSERAC